MKERPILFNGEMVRAVLDGRKTQTRRVAKNLRNTGDPLAIEWARTHCPYGAPGDRLWVRECFAKDGWGHLPGHDVVLYRATWHGDPDYPVKWKPSIHMPRWASRITLEVTGVRVERVQDITECEARREGVTCERALIGNAARLAFRSLWDSINKKRGYGWDVNPWVWVVEFRRVA